MVGHSLYSLFSFIKSVLVCKAYGWPCYFVELLVYCETETVPYLTKVLFG